MKTYKQFGINLALRAGEIMMQNFAFDMKREWKADNTPVTVSDIAINKMVIESILNEYPNHGILGEEESFLKDGEYVWVCDPLDGTMPFSFGMPTFTFALALTHNGDPIVGVVYDPVMKRMYTAEKGEGAYLNEKKITVSQAAVFKNQFIGLEASHRAPYIFDNFRSMVDEKGVRFISLACLTYSSLFVAKGEFLASIYAKSAPWDCAAVKIIIDEAGGKTTDLFGNEQRYDKPVKGFIGSNGVIHKQLVDMMHKTLKKK